MRPTGLRTTRQKRRQALHLTRQASWKTGQCQDRRRASPSWNSDKARISLTPPGITVLTAPRHIPPASHLKYDSALSPLYLPTTTTSRPIRFRLNSAALNPRRSQRLQTHPPRPASFASSTHRKPPKPLRKNKNNQSRPNKINCHKRKLSSSHHHLLLAPNGLPYDMQNKRDSQRRGIAQDQAKQRRNHQHAPRVCERAAPVTKKQHQEKGKYTKRAQQGIDDQMKNNQIHQKHP
jgi:hypothetical protein